MEFPKKARDYPALFPGAETAIYQQIHGRCPGTGYQVLPSVDSLNDKKVDSTVVHLCHEDGSNVDNFYEN
jgi:hypothetical protein